MKWLASLISLSVTLFVAEHLVRLVHPAPSVFRFLLGGKESAYQLSSNPVLGYELKSNVRSDTPDCHHTFDYTNALGQRDKERSPDATSGKKRIILLGDSVVAGHGICKMENTISQQLERVLDPEKTEVLNFGIGGYCTRAEVELLKTKGLQFHPDEVAVLFVNNDYINSNGSILGQIKAQRPSWLEYAFRKSHIVRWLCLQYDIADFRKDFDPKQRSSANQNALGDSNIADGMELLSKLAAEKNFKVQVFLWPYFTDGAIEEPRPIENRNDTEPLLIETLAQQYGIQTHRLSPFFIEDFEKFKASRTTKPGKKISPRWTYTIGDGIHPSERGAETAARAIASILGNEGSLIQKPLPS
jgi:hypothetical protein